jgi:glycosyltransferase involved in cell wall biosynthesis
MIIGIDASHTVAGGAISHLKNLLTNINFDKFSIKRIYVWVPKKTINLLPKNKNVIYKHHFLFKYNFLFKLFWQLFFFSKSLKKANCNIVFITGGYFFINFRPIVSLSQNILPFYKKEVIKYFPSFFYIKLIILKLFLINSFNRSNKVIFLSKYAYKFTKKFLKQNFEADQIPHCLDNKIINYLKRNQSKPFRKTIKIIFISDITFYKNHRNLLLAVSSIRKDFNIKLTLIGGYEEKCFDSFVKLKNQLDPSGEFIIYKGLLSHKNTMNYLKNSDIFFYSSYCESFSVSILEGMASRKPMLISNSQVFKEVVKFNATYFDIDSLEDLKSKLLKIIKLPLDKKKLFIVNNNRILLQKYNQKLVREQTFFSLKKTFDNYYS